MSRWFKKESQRAWQSRISEGQAPALPSVTKSFQREQADPSWGVRVVPPAAGKKVDLPAGSFLHVSAQYLAEGRAQVAEYAASASAAIREMLAEARARRFGMHHGEAAGYPGAHLGVGNPCPARVVRGPLAQRPRRRRRPQFLLHGPEDVLVRVRPRKVGAGFVHHRHLEAARRGARPGDVHVHPVLPAVVVGVELRFHPQALPHPLGGVGKGGGDLRLPIGNDVRGGYGRPGDRRTAGRHTADWRTGGRPAAGTTGTRDAHEQQGGNQTNSQRGTRGRHVAGCGGRSAASPAGDGSTI